MANIDNYPPGSFCWFELATSDQDAAKKFYESLFGWSHADMPMGPGEVYTMFKLEGRDTGAAFTLRPEMKAQGVPPHWGIYIAAASAVESAAKAAQLGGKVLAPPFDVFDVGRMAVVQDPGGAIFNLWQEKRQVVAGISGVPGTFCWADLVTKNIEASRQFYTGLLGWEFGVSDHDTSGYLHIKNGEEFIGGVPPAEHQNPNAPPHWMLYFLVASVAESTAKAQELGARVYMGPMAMPNVGDLAILADPQGAVFALFTPARRS